MTRNKKTEKERETTEQSICHSTELANLRKIFLKEPKFIDRTNLLKAILIKILRWQRILGYQKFTYKTNLHKAF